MIVFGYADVRVISNDLAKLQTEISVRHVVRVAFAKDSPQLCASTPAFSKVMTSKMNKHLLAIVTFDHLLRPTAHRTTERHPEKPSHVLTAGLHLRHTLIARNLDRHSVCTAFAQLYRLGGEQYWRVTVLGPPEHFAMNFSQEPQLVSVGRNERNWSGVTSESHHGLFVAIF